MSSIINLKNTLSKAAIIGLAVVTATTTQAQTGSAKLDKVLNSAASQAWSAIGDQVEGKTVAIFPCMKNYKGGAVRSSLCAEDLIQVLEGTRPQGIRVLANHSLVQALEEMVWSPGEYPEKSSAAYLAESIGADYVISGWFTSSKNKNGHSTEFLSLQVAEIGQDAEVFKLPLVRDSTLGKHLLSLRPASPVIAFGNDPEIPKIEWNDKMANGLFNRHMARELKKFIDGIPSPTNGAIGVMPVWKQDTQSYSEFSERIGALVVQGIKDRGYPAFGAMRVDRLLRGLDEPRSVMWYSLDAMDEKYLDQFNMSGVVLTSYSFVKGGRLSVEFQYVERGAVMPSAQHRTYVLDYRLEDKLVALNSGETSAAYKFPEVEIDWQKEVQSRLNSDAVALLRSHASQLVKGERLFVGPVGIAGTSGIRAVIHHVNDVLDEEFEELRVLAAESDRELEDVLNTQPIRLFGEPQDSFRAAEGGFEAALEASLSLGDSGRKEVEMADLVNDAIRNSKAYGELVLQRSSRSARAGNSNRKKRGRRGKSKGTQRKTIRLRDARYTLLCFVVESGDLGLKTVVELRDNETDDLIGSADSPLPRVLSKGVRKKLATAELTAPASVTHLFDKYLPDSAIQSKGAVEAGSKK